MERVHRWFGWHPLFAIVIASFPAMVLVGIAATAPGHPHPVLGVVIAALLLAPSSRSRSGGCGAELA